MSERIEIPAANLQNISVFSEEPNEGLINEIKQHVRATSLPCTWWGHSHTKPDAGAFVVYIEEFDVPAPDTVERVAPCPCCSPHHPKYKNKGKIAWFPDESVIRLIGPKCFAAINAAGHDDALADLRRRQKRRRELDTIARHMPAAEALMATIDEALPIAEDLDIFMQEINRVIDNELHLHLWREVKEGNLTTSETRKVSFQKADGTIGVRTDEARVLFARISGYAMIDRSGRPLARKLSNVRSGLAMHVSRLAEAKSSDDLEDAERERIADAFPKGRIAALEILSAMVDRQRFLTSNAIDVLNQWGQHPKAPVSFSIERRKLDVVLSVPTPYRTGAYPVRVGSSAMKPIPKVPELEVP